VLNTLYDRSVVRLPGRSCLVVILNAYLPCYSFVADMGTVGFDVYAAAYGTLRVAVVQYYHYADWLTREPDVDVFVHEFGRSLRHPGTLASEYDDLRDAVDDSGVSVRLSSWLGITSYRLSGVCRFLICIISGLGGLWVLALRGWLVGPRGGVYVSGLDGVCTVEYKCGFY
jgi:hypothetical protein